MMMIIIMMITQRDWHVCKFDKLRGEREIDGGAGGGGAYIDRKVGKQIN